MMQDHPFAALLSGINPITHRGVLQAVLPGRLESMGPKAVIGDLCKIVPAGGEEEKLAEVVALTHDKTVLMPLDSCESLSVGDRVIRTDTHRMTVVGEGLKGRILSALGKPIDGRPEATADFLWPLAGKPLNPMERDVAASPLSTGVRAIDGCLPLAKGQRIGIFAASGVGKTTLVEQIMQNVEADNLVLCLVGERGREGAVLWSALQAAGIANKATLFVATSDESAAVRARVVNAALAQAEYLRSKNKDVVLFVDSSTRYAMALREMGLSAGEPPTVRAYTPNVFAQLPRMVERCGASASGGSITAFFTVLAETDDVDDPIVEVMKSLLDGHIILSREIAASGRYPAIDVLNSVSRLADKVICDRQQKALLKLRASMFRLREAQLLIESGLHKPGNNKSLDRSIARRSDIETFLAQSTSGAATPTDTLNALEKLVEQL